jgi:hypothetical protein
VTRCGSCAEASESSSWTGTKVLSTARGTVVCENAVSDQQARKSNRGAPVQATAVYERRLSMQRTYIRFLAVLGIAAFPASQAVAQINLGTSASFAVLGGSTVTNTGASAITGNLGVSPGSSVTGFPPGIVTGGAIHAGDSVAAQAQSDLTTAYNAAAGLPCGVDLTGQNLGGLTLTPAVYCFTSSAALTGTLTLNFQGNPNALFLFRIGSTLTTASGSSVVLSNTGGTTCPTNLFWQVGSSATLGTGSTFAGNILALTSITMNTGAGLTGRALARNGAVTLDTGIVNASACAAVAPPIPALGSAGLMILVLLLAGAGMFVLRRLA